MIKMLLKTTSLKSDKNVLFAYVYGSFARGEKDFSDLDIAVYLKKIPRGIVLYERRLAKALEKETGKPVDVRIINSMPLLLKSRLLKEGALIFSRNQKARIAFETALISSYLDFSHIMKEFNEKRLERYEIR
ncbi:MAG: nucleotidyltransferase domain-containing protein [Candidatus Aenigmarchaeota archaeon]|nr:nucleotidyltransferase domain-containing protein [Candidatus Aenigmarchaeota archaeon]